MLQNKIIWIIPIGFILFGIFLLVGNKDVSEIQYVSGNGHIYRGQQLDPNWEMKLESLSSRSKWLKTKQYVDIRMKDNLERMILDAEKDGMCLVVISSYRSFEHQSGLYFAIEDKSKVALPGESEHHTGLAIDFTACPMKDGIRNDSIERLELKNDFKDLPEYCWLVKSAWAYGFEQSFTEYNKDISGYSAEAWHWKFIIN